MSTTTSNIKLPLAGLRVLDWSRLLPGALVFADAR
jgi:hypothetical protein